MRTYTSVIENIHHKLCKQLIELDLLLGCPDSSETYWEILRLTSQVERNCRLEAELLADIEEHLDTTHWVIATVMRHAHHRIAAVLRNLEDLKARVREHIVSLASSRHSEDHGLLIGTTTEFRRQLDFTETVVLRMLSLLAHPSASNENSHIRGGRYLCLVKQDRKTH